MEGVKSRGFTVRIGSVVFGNSAFLKEFIAKNNISVNAPIPDLPAEKTLGLYFTENRTATLHTIEELLR